MFPDNSAYIKILTIGVLQIIMKQQCHNSTS